MLPLRISSLNVTRGGTRILRDISWQIQPGEMWTILGANGSGKTSLLSCLTGWLPASSGTVTVLGETYGESDWTELRRRVGVVSSSLRQQVDEDETALSVIASGISGQVNYWGTHTAAERRLAEQMARRLRCGSLLERPWQVLSQGERQRVLTGRALMQKPALLILDEPCAGLDPVARERFVSFMQGLAADSVTGRKQTPAVILVTHHLEEIPPACTHVLALRNGRIEAKGPLSDVLRNETLSRVFGAPVRVARRASDQRRWEMELVQQGCAIPERQLRL